MARFYITKGRYKPFEESKYARYVKEKRGAALPTTNETPVHGSYGPLLFRKEWRDRRASILARDGYKCIICNATEDLQVHHRQYHFVLATKEFKPPWNYDDKLLISLCERCHQRGHAKFTVPTIQI